MVKSVNTPAKLKIASAEIHANAMQKRQDFASFMRVSGLHDVIFKHLATRDGVNGIGNNNYFIGGSQAWKEWAAASVPSSVSLTPMERSAFVAGNADVFYLSDSEEGCDRLMCDLHAIMAHAIKRECDALLAEKGYPYHIRIDTHGFTSSTKQCTFDAPKLTYTMFPAYSMMFHLERKRSTRGGHLDVEEPFDGKLVLYLEVCHVPHLDVDRFAQRYIQVYNGFHYLNALGLVTFATMISQSRLQDKGGIDVDRLRNEVVAKVYPIADVYDQVYDNFHHVFHQCPDVYTESVVNNMRLIAMKHRSVSVNALCDVFEMWLIEKLRPFINSFIAVTSQEIQEATHNDAFMFIVGGDAMRRYKKSISVTKDIDTKVYFSLSKTKATTTKKKGVKKTKTAAPKKTNRTIVIDIVRKNMCRLITYLIKYKGHIFADHPDGTLGFDKEDNGVTAAIKFMTNNPANVQFRIREIKKSPLSLPVDLFSVDYRAYFQGTYKGVKFNLKYDVPILDVAIQQYDPEHYKKSDIVDQSSSIPVASLDFLIDDITSTYKNDTLLAQRVAGKKRGKDMHRFYKLREIFMKRVQNPEGRSKSSTPQNVMGVKVELNKTIPDAIRYIHTPDDNVPATYLKTFEEMHTKKQRALKFKMPFDSKLLQMEIETLPVHQYVNDNIVLSKSSSSRRSVEMEDVFKRGSKSTRSMSMS